ncbi:hypothetical protein A2130_00635 [Candidatus Woesebacteria bacterium GWC2_33_12]|uniref:Uncharacterized protein n=1 Tax=Candidatus Woesebacteria bacterium GW2011_GWB1_33_22 TaxID=1618566 RepID=A0A0G0C266_9BACT|nr:MAG: hypothetical protein UR29_C0002G0020 [Candidatus Woesebacteria bacterium GW2011_GWC2_33_12]KKP42492.1 MAG: hypothetical protein UR33_C0002G0068 [Candidatus Woesebacteria bacterium GW2011_GWA2_33_20]KKP45235.1 MAG: hypothetical protein UR35_C0002G0068 [Candidatus Woesebacteria bacterium GW2011_GWB1_33_22]KKP46470.1 MAG: hypothetical protein UR37_C0007G0027 [Microgenomates group bacterium GW2011_GWC1_33_28]KKP50905.1 MAG: hypothetical protein UR41_C0002G0069 [Candidatus Woesebacteria bact
MRKGPPAVRRGFSLIEILVVISIFAVIGILTTRSIFLTIRGAKKSDSLVRVRENVNYAMGVMERQIRNAQSIDCVSSTASIIYYTALEGVDSTISCVDDYIASGSGRLTSSDIVVTNCSLSCIQTDINSPISVRISIAAEDTVSTSVEKGSVTSETEIIARNY